MVVHSALSQYANRESNLSSKNNTAKIVIPQKKKKKVKSQGYLLAQKPKNKSKSKNKIRGDGHKIIV